MRNLKSVLLVLLFILYGCAAQEQVAEVKPTAPEPVPAKEVPLSVAANFCAGFYAMIGGEWQLAAGFFEKALEGDPASEKILRYIIACHVQLNQEDKALLYMSKLSDINREDFLIHYTLANIYEEDGKTDKAIIEYERATRSDIRLADKALMTDALYRLAHLYFNKKEPAKAASCLKDIIRLAPPIDVSTFYAEMGLAYIETKEYEDALEALETAKELNPFLPQARLYLAIVYDESGELDKAIAEANAFLEASPSDKWLAHAFLAGLYAKADQTDNADLHRKEAIDLLQLRVAQGAGDTREHLALARLLIAENKKTAALRIMELASDKSKTKDEATEVHFLLANLYYETNHPEQVEPELREALRIDPDFHEASNFLGYFFADRGE